MNDALASQLAPPGAGIPKAELAWVRPVFRLASCLLSDARATARFDREARQMLGKIATLSPEQASRQVLIKRVVGIEDSSRYWSAYMVMEHLRIVNEIIARIVASLGADRPFPQEIRTADVKPSPSVGHDVLASFENGVRTYIADVMPSLRCRTRLTHVHPWFGPLNAHGWHCLAAIHHTLHRRQLTAILRML